MLGEWTPFVMPFLIILNAALVYQNRGALRVACVLMLFGVISNFLALAANDWKMPVLGRTEAKGVHVPLTADAGLWLLTDIFPAGMSVGDVLLLSGLVVIYGITLRRLYDPVR